MHLCPIPFFAFMLVLTLSSTALGGEIHEAVKANDLSKVKKLIKDNPDLIISKDEDGFTPLHLSAANGYKKIVELMLTNKADVNSKDKNGSTPLHRAAAAIDSLPGTQ